MSSFVPHGPHIRTTLREKLLTIASTQASAFELSTSTLRPQNRDWNRRLLGSGLEINPHLRITG